MSKWKKTLPPDPVMNVVSSANEAAWRSAMQPVDQKVWQVEKRWGCLERLIEQVSPELAARFGSAWFKLNAAVLDGDPEQVADRASVVIRGIDALEKEAGNNWSPEVWGITVDGATYLICHRTKDVRVVATEAGDGVTVWSLEELIRVSVSSQAGAYAEIAKRLFPEATITAIKEGDRPLHFSKGESPNDRIPF